MTPGASGCLGFQFFKGPQGRPPSRGFHFVRPRARWFSAGARLRSSAWHGAAFAKRPGSGAKRSGEDSRTGLIMLERAHHPSDGQAHPTKPQQAPNQANGEQLSLGIRKLRLSL